ncbi:bifunctional DedA family/phosphatase PAP2 family protein [Metapseudomonas boanensis]|uniref:Bifunctional DedA family/phosphatase PAP2 family protein n=1 Tax=Metapseudomonas boanensis TaxID=2822138 RepID=A0ABS5XDR5_9GAMM|nr:bifunctional DedA family/phosphatase PAP2 family protein [Pseudomonas boanensis]MBT8765413.1 bifunctional DedA family/phosphatase PAP2 family protein [Pseudomonas boanensis]
MTQWYDQVTAWLGANPEWLGLAIFLIACIECLAVAGIVVPGVALLFAVGVMAGSGALELWETLLLAYTGGLVGDLISYGIGRRFHQNIRGLPLLRDHPEWIGSAETYFQRYGVASLLLGRYIGPLRPMLPMVAGMLDMPLPRFIAVSMLAAAGWAVAYLLPGWATGAALRLPLPEGFWGEAAVVLAAMAIVLGLIIQATLLERRWANPMAAGLCLAALAALLLGWPHLQGFDQGLMALVQDQRTAKLDHFMVLITRLGDFQTQLLVGAALGALLLIARQWRAAGFAIATLAATGLANSALKHFFARARPDILMEPLTSYSFPSGHSSAAFAFFLVLGILAGRGQPGRLRLTWLLLACLPALAIALSRVYLGVHWPSDVLAGSLLAACICAACLVVMQRAAPLSAMAPQVWLLVLSACLALFGGIATWALPTAIARYSY